MPRALRQILVARTQSAFPFEQPNHSSFENRFFVLLVFCALSLAAAFAAGFCSVYYKWLRKVDVSGIGASTSGGGFVVSTSSWDVGASTSGGDGGGDGASPYAS